MTSKHERKPSAVLSNFAVITLLAIAGAGASAVWAQSTSLRPPGSATSPMGASQLNSRPQLSVTPAVPAAAGSLAATPGATANTAELGTQVLHGAAVGKREKLAAVSSMLLAAAKTEQDQVKKAALEAAAKAPDMDAGVSLTLANPKAPLGHLSFIDASINFDKGDVYISPKDPKSAMGGVGPGVQCDFKRNVNNTGFYLMNFVVEITPDMPTKKMKTLVGVTSSTGGQTFAVSPGVLQILVPLKPSTSKTFVTLASDGPFYFKSCDISTVHSPN